MRHWAGARPMLRRAALLIAVAAMLACSWFGMLDSAAGAQLDAGLKRALVSFASARGLNAVISLAQGTELALQPAGIGVNLSVGQVLDPVNDLIEQFSNLMLLASVAFGVQKVLLVVGSHWAVSLVLTVATLAWTLLAFSARSAPIWLSRLAVVLLVLRFAIPVATIGSDRVFQHFLAHDYAASQQVIGSTAGQLEAIKPPVAAGPQSSGLLDKLRGWAGSQGTAWNNRLDELKLAVERATEHIIKLIVIFLLQTLIVPALLLWAVVAVGRAALTRPAIPA